MLEAAQRYTPDYRIGGYLCGRIIVEEGVLSILKEAIANQDQGYVPKIEVWKDAVIHIYENDEKLTTITLDGIYGEGTICCNTATLKTFNLNSGTTSDFAGQLTGNLKLAVPATGITVNLRGTNNTFRSLAPAASSTRKYSTIGFIGGSVLPTDPDSLSTNKSVSSGSWYACYKYLGGPGGVCAKTFYWSNVSEVPGWTEIGTLDGGEVGGLTLNASSGIERGGTFDRFPMRFVFAGENPIECVFAGKIIQPDDGRGVWNWKNTSPIAVVKRGSGIWHFADNDDRKNTGVVAVDAGTLRFDSIAPVGQICSLGAAIHQYDPELTNTWSSSATAYPYPDTLPQVPYHIRIGHNGTRGTLEYRGTADVDSDSRILAVDGEGALVNATDNAFAFHRIITAGEGDHTLVLGGDTAADNVAGDISAGEDSTLGVVKEGAGSWKLDRTVGVNGAVTVKEGALEVSNLERFKFFRMNVTENAGNGHNWGTPGWSNTVYLCQFALYDADGHRCGYNLREVNRTAALQPGTFRVSQAASSSNLANMFDPATNFVSKIPTLNSSKRYIQQTNEESWVSFEMRLQDDEPEIVAFDYVISSGYYSTYNFTTPWSFKFEGSADGVNWVDLCVTNDLGNAYDAQRWGSTASLGEGKREPYYPDVQDRPGKGFFFSRRAVAPIYPTALVGAGPISVAGGAKLAYEGDVAPIAALSVDATGENPGVIAGATFAGEGTLTVTGVPSGTKCMTLPLTFADVVGLENIAGWTVIVNGRSGSFDARIVNGRIEILRHGFMLIVR